MMTELNATPIERSVSVFGADPNEDNPQSLVIFAVELRYTISGWEAWWATKERPFSHEWVPLEEMLAQAQSSMENYLSFLAKTKN